MLSRNVAIGLSDLYRQHRQAGMASIDAWHWLRNYEPDANVYERRRIEARGEQCLEIYFDVLADDPPVRLNILYPLPPSTEMPQPYLLETVWKVLLDVDGVITPRMLIVDVPANSLWTTLLAELEGGVTDLASDYDAEFFPIVEFILVR